MSLLLRQQGQAQNPSITTRTIDIYSIHREMRFVKEETMQKYKPDELPDGTKRGLAMIS